MQRVLLFISLLMCFNVFAYNKTYTKIEAVVLSICDEKGIVDAFLTNPSISFAKAEYDNIKKNKVEMTLNDEASEIPTPNDIKITASSYGCQVGDIEVQTRSILSNEVEIEFTPGCNAESVISALNNNTKILSIKSDFKEGESEVKIYTASYLSDFEIKSISDLAECKVVFVERK